MVLRAQALDYDYAFSYGTPSAEKVSYQAQSYASIGYMQNSVVFGLIQRRIALFSEAKFKFRLLEDKSIFGNTSLAKLEQPWPGASTGELLARMEQDVSIYGNAYIRDAGSQLERLQPDKVTIVSAIVIDANGEQVRQVQGYYYEPTDDPDRQPAYYPVDEVAHWSPIPDPLRNFMGMSWMTPVLREINSDIAMVEHQQKYYQNAATPNLLLRYQKELSPAQVERITQFVQERHSGTANAHNTMVLDNGADATVIGSNMHDAGFTDALAANENRIAVASGVPSIVAGLKEGLAAATLANYSQAMRAFADLTMRPNWRSVCAALAKLVDVPAGAELWYDTSDISALQDGEQEQAQTFSVDAKTASTLVQAGYTPESVATAIAARDMTLLVHTGLYSVQLQPPIDGTPVIPQTVNGNVPALTGVN